MEVKYYFPTPNLSSMHLFVVVAATCTGEMALAGYRLYYGPSAGLVAAVLVKLGAAFHHASQPDRAVECLHQADQIYTTIPGVKSQFYRKEFKPVFDKIVDSI